MNKTEAEIQKALEELNKELEYLHAMIVIGKIDLIKYEESIKTLFSQALHRVVEVEKEELKEEIKKMLWSIHEDENDRITEAWNRSLDLAIFKLSHSEDKGDNE